jgi:hypothetical protein
VQQIAPLSDERWAAFCAYCGEAPTTRDHVPPRVFMDVPYPDNVPIVQSCRDCNEGASLDELYVACLLEVAICGSADPARVRRQKIASAIQKRPGHGARLAASLSPGRGVLLNDDDTRRISAVVEKIARGLWSYETSESAGLSAATSSWALLECLTPLQADSFRRLAEPKLLPEVGSRMLTRVLTSDSGLAPPRWIVVQPGRFSYAAARSG